MAEVYICYSKWNQEDAARVTELLEEKGVTCWLVSRDINYAKDWDEQIENAVKSSVISIYLQPAEPSFRVLEDGTIRPVYLYTVDADEFVVNKLLDRGSLAATTIVTNVQDFITIVANGLKLDWKQYSKARQ